MGCFVSKSVKVADAKHHEEKPPATKAEQANQHQQLDNVREARNEKEMEAPGGDLAYVACTHLDNIPITDNCDLGDRKKSGSTATTQVVPESDTGTVNVGAVKEAEVTVGGNAEPNDSEIDQSKSKVEHAREEYPLGARFQLDSGLCGTVRYVGPAPGTLNNELHAGHIYVLLELETASGNSNGIIGGVTLVKDIPPKHAYFCGVHHIASPAPSTEVLKQASELVASSAASEKKIVRIQSMARKRKARKVVHTVRHARATLSEDFLKVDKHALDAPESARESLSALVDYLCTPFSDNRILMARAIFRWCCENMEYDCGVYYGGRKQSQKSEDVLKSGKCVCAGYSNIVKSLCDLVSIPCVTISGCAKAAGYRLGMTESELTSNHAWNAMYLDGKWEMIECTWASGCVDTHKFIRRFDNSWWCTSPDTFCYTHFPTGHVNISGIPEAAEIGSDASSWQMLSDRPPVTKSEWAKLGWIRPRFFDLGLKFTSTSKLNYNTVYHNGSTPFSLKFECPPDVDPTASVDLLKKSGSTVRLDQTTYSVVEERQTSNEVSVYVKFNKEHGHYIVSLFGSKSSQHLKSASYLLSILVIHSGGPTVGGVPLSIKKAAMELGIRNLSHPNDEIDHGTSKQALAVKLACPTDANILCNLENAKGKSIKNATSHMRDPKNPTNQCIVYVKFPLPGRYTLNLFAKKADVEGSYGFALKYTIFANSTTVGGVPITVSEKASKLGFNTLSHPNDEIDHGTSKQALAVKFLCPTEVSILCNLENAKGEKIENATSHMRDPKKPFDQCVVYAKFPERGTYRMKIYAKHVEEEGALSSALTYKVFVKSETTCQLGFPTIYGAAKRRFKIFAITHPHICEGGTLKLGSTISKFQVICHGGETISADSIKLHVCGEWGQHLTHKGDAIWESNSVKIEGENPSEGVCIFLDTGSSCEGLCRWEVDS